MIEIATVPSEPMFDDAFESMVIQGDVGIAVSKETPDYRLCVSIGKTEERYWKIILEGEPYQITKSERISQEEHDSYVALLAGISARNGMVAADVLDGETFMLKWRTIDEEFRFMLCNPKQLESEWYKRLGMSLENWVKRL